MKYAELVSRETAAMFVLKGGDPHGSSNAPARVSGPHRDGRKKDGCHYHRRMPDKERRATPPAFRDLLLSIARSTHPKETDR